MLDMRLGRQRTAPSGQVGGVIERTWTKASFKQKAIFTVWSVLTSAALFNVIRAELALRQARRIRW